MPALARVQHDAARLALAVRDGLRLQLLLVGPALLALALVGVPVATWLFGPRWAALQDVMALLAAGTLCNAVFNLHSSALYAQGYPGRVWIFHVVHVAMFAGAAALLVPDVGIRGYGLAEVVAFPSYAVVWWAYRRSVRAGIAADAAAPAAGLPSSRAELLLGAGFVAAVTLSVWTPWAALLALLPWLQPSLRERARESVATLRQTLVERLA